MAAVCRADPVGHYGFFVALELVVIAGLAALFTFVEPAAGCSADGLVDVGALSDELRPQPARIATLNAPKSVIARDKILVFMVFFCVV